MYNFLHLTFIYSESILCAYKLKYFFPQAIFYTYNFCHEASCLFIPPTKNLNHVLFNSLLPKTTRVHLQSEGCMNFSTAVPAYLLGRCSKTPNGYLKLDNAERYVMLFFLYIHTFDEFIHKLGIVRQ